MLLHKRELENDKEKYIPNIDLLWYVLVFLYIDIKVNGNGDNPKQAGLLIAKTLWE